MAKDKSPRPVKGKWEKPVLVRLGQIKDVAAAGTGNDQPNQPLGFRS